MKNYKLLKIIKGSIINIHGSIISIKIFEKIEFGVLKLLCIKSSTMEGIKAIHSGKLKF